MRVRSVDQATQAEIDIFENLLPRVVQNVNEWRSEHSIQIKKLAALKEDLSKLTAHIKCFDFKAPRPWQHDSWRGAKSNCP